MPTPSITTLSQQYGHARQTCAKALRTLEDEGLLTRIPGLGYYVTGTAAAGSSATADTVLGPLRPAGYLVNAAGTRIASAARRTGQADRAVAGAKRLATHST
jgi:DNA-binding transcriptional MocR family regulator